MLGLPEGQSSAQKVPGSSWQHLGELVGVKPLLHRGGSKWRSPTGEGARGETGSLFDGAPAKEGQGR